MGIALIDRLICRCAALPTRFRFDNARIHSKSLTFDQTGVHAATQQSIEKRNPQPLVFIKKSEQPPSGQFEEFLIFSVFHPRRQVLAAFRRPNGPTYNTDSPVAHTALVSQAFPVWKLGVPNARRNVMTAVLIH